MRILRISLVFFAFYLTFIGGSSYYDLSFAIRVVHHLVITLILSLWLLKRLRSRQGLPSSGINGWLYAAIVIWIVTATLGIDPRVSLEHTWFLIVHVLLFLGIVGLLQRKLQRLVFESVFFMAACVLMLTCIELGSWYFGWGLIPGTSIGWQVTGQLPGLNDIPPVSLAMSVSTLLSGYVAPLVIITTGWSATTPRRDYRVGLAILSFLLAIVLILTDSRGGLISIIVASGIILTYSAIRTKRAQAILSPTRAAFLSISILAAVIVFFIWVTLPQGAGRSNDGRLDMWRGAVSIAIDHPITGVGPGMFGAAFREYRNPAIAQDKLASAHNVVFNTMAETGIAGAIIAIGLLINIGRLTWRNWKQSSDPIQRKRLIIVGAALLGIAGHSMVDVFSGTGIVLLVLVMIAYLITPIPASRLDKPPQGDTRAAWIMLILVMIYGVGLLQSDRAQGYYMASLDIVRDDEALQDVRAAIAINPNMKLYRLHEAYLLHQTGQRDAAITAYTTVLEKEPTWDTGWINLAALYEQSEQPHDALEALQKAYAINELTSAPLHWARLAEELNAAPENLIAAAYVRAIRNEQNRTLPLSAFWDQTPLRQQAVAEYAENQAIDFQYRIYAVHNPARLPELLKDNPVTAMDWWIQGEFALTHKNDPAAAENAFTRAIELAPRSRLGDYYASRARARKNINAAGAWHDLDLAQVYRTVHEYPNAIRAELTSDPQLAEALRASALPLRTVPQEFAAVHYDRPAVFDIPPTMRHPGFSHEALLPWLTVAETYRQTDPERARNAYRFVYTQSPYDPYVMDAYERYVLGP